MSPTYQQTNRDPTPRRPQRDEITGKMMQQPISDIECYECGRTKVFRHVGSQMVCAACGHVMGKPVNEQRSRRLKAARQQRPEA